MIKVSEPILQTNCLLDLIEKKYGINKKWKKRETKWRTHLVFRVSHEKR